MQSLMDAPLAPDKLIDKILIGLGDELTSLSFSLRARESSISFDELHENLFTFEACLKQKAAKTSSAPSMAYVATKLYPNCLPTILGS